MTTHTKTLTREQLYKKIRGYYRSRTGWSNIGILAGYYFAYNWEYFRITMSHSTVVMVCRGRKPVPKRALTTTKTVRLTRS